MSETALRLLLWGDVGGAFGVFQESLGRAVGKFGGFDACVCVGDFFGHVASTRAGREQFPLLERVRALLPAELAVQRVFVFDQPAAADSIGAELQAAARTAAAPLPLSEVFTLLPPRGCSVICDHLRVATCAHLPPAAPAADADSPLARDAPDPPADWQVVDLALVSAWPENLQAGLTGDDLLAIQNALHQGGLEDPLRARATYNFLSELPPARYIVAAGTPQVFYQRPAFQRSPDAPVPTRFVALSSMRSKTAPSAGGAPRKFLHALRVCPWALQPNAQPPLSQIANSPLPPMYNKRIRLEAPPASTPSTQQFTPDAGPRGGWSDLVDRRRESSISDDDESDSAPASTEPLFDASRFTLYVSNVPYGSTGDDLRRAIDPIARTTRVRFPRTAFNEQKHGRAWVSFTSLQDARKLLSGGKVIELGGRKLRFDWAKNSLSELRRSGSAEEAVSMASPPPPPPPVPPPGGPDTVTIDTRPHQDCWFCLVNPNCEKRLMCHVGNCIYIAIAKGGVNQHHCLLLPASHQPNLGYASGSIVEECETLMRELREVNAEQGLATIMFERYIPMKHTRTMHTQVHAIGFPVGLTETVIDAMTFRTVRDMSSSLSWESRDAVLTLPETLRQLAAANGGDFVHQCYWWITISGGGRACTILGVTPSSAGVNLNLAREVLTHALNLPDRVQWKNCVNSVPQEAEAAACLKQLLSSHLARLPATYPPIRSS